MLCQSIYRDQQFRVVVGVGLNVSNRQPSTCIDAAIEEQHRQLGLPGDPAPVRPEVSACFVRDGLVMVTADCSFVCDGLCGVQELLASTLNTMEIMLSTLADQGFAPLEKTYTDNWMHTGQQVRKPSAEIPTAQRRCSAELLPDAGDARGR